MYARRGHKTTITTTKTSRTKQNENAVVRVVEGGSIITPSFLSFFMIMCYSQTYEQSTPPATTDSQSTGTLILLHPGASSRTTVGLTGLLPIHTTTVYDCHHCATAICATKQSNQVHTSQKQSNHRSICDGVDHHDQANKQTPVSSSSNNSNENEVGYYCFSDAAERRTHKFLINPSTRSILLLGTYTYVDIMLSGV